MVSAEQQTTSRKCEKRQHPIYERAVRVTCLHICAAEHADLRACASCDRAPSSGRTLESVYSIKHFHGQTKANFDWPTAHFLPTHAI
jgi:hypothetical protein